MQSPDREKEMEMERQARRKKIKSREMDRMALITGRIQNLDPTIAKSSSFSDIRTDDLPKHSRSSSEPAPPYMFLDRTHGECTPPPKFNSIKSILQFYVFRINSFIMRQILQFIWLATHFHGLKSIGSFFLFIFFIQILLLYVRLRL